MGKFDHIFDSEDTTEESLSPEEAVAAIAVIAGRINSGEVDADTIESTLLQSEIFDEYSEDEMSELVEKLAGIAEAESLGALFNAAYESLEDDLVLDAFAVTVAMFIIDNEVPRKKKPFFQELQEALGIEDDEAQEIIEDVIVQLSEDEEYEDDEKYDGVSVAQLAAVAAGIYEEESGDREWYESPIGNFRVPIPVESQRGGKVNEEEGMVGFSDDFGTLLRIDYAPFPSEVEEEIDSIGLEAFLKSFLDNYVAEGILSNISGARVLHEEYLDDVGDGAYFTVVDMPQGSTLSLQKGDSPPTRSNAYRGFFSLIAEGFLYTISSQRHFWDGEQSGPLEAEVEGIRDKILGFLETMEFAEA